MASSAHSNTRKVHPYQPDHKLICPNGCKPVEENPGEIFYFIKNGAKSTDDKKLRKHYVLMLPESYANRRGIYDQKYYPCLVVRNFMLFRYEVNPNKTHADNQTSLRISLYPFIPIWTKREQMDLSL